MLDIARGALDAHLHPGAVTGRGPTMVQRYRMSAIVIFCAFVLYGLAVSATLRLRDPLPSWMSAADMHPELRVLLTISQAAAAVALVAFTIGGTPMVVAALQNAVVQRRRDVLACFGAVIALVVLFAAYTGVVAVVVGNRPVATHAGVVATGNLPSGAGNPPLRPIDAALGLGWVAFLVLGFAVGMLLISIGLSRSELSEQVLRFTRVPAAIVVVAMAVTTVATLLLDIRMSAVAPETLAAQDVDSVLLAGIITVLVLSTLLAAVGYFRGRISSSARPAVA